MPIEFRCDCGKKFRTAGENAGKSMKCSQCGAKLTVPSPETDDEEEVYEAELAEEEDDEDDAPLRRSAQEKRQNRSPDEQPAAHPTRKKGKAAGGKSKGAKDQDEAPKSYLVPLLIGGVVVGILLMMGVAIAVVPSMLRAFAKVGENQAAAQARRNFVPLDLEPFRSPDFNFKCQVPKGWEINSGGGSGNIPPWVRAESKRAKISFRASQSGTLIGDIAGAGQTPQDEIPDELKPIHKVHEFQGHKLKEELQDYVEIGEIEKLQTAMGEARLSTFTASGDFGAKIFAIRVSLVENQWQWNLVCQCSSQQEFDNHVELFRKVAQSAGG